MFENDTPFESFAPAEEVPFEVNPALEEFTPAEIQMDEAGLSPLENYELEESQEAMAALSPELFEQGDTMGYLAPEQQEELQQQEETVATLPPEQGEQYENETVSTENESALNTEQVTEEGANQFDEYLTEE